MIAITATRTTAGVSTACRGRRLDTDPDSRDIGESRYRCQFFYSEAEQYGTGKDEYDSLDNCVLTPLQVQADHERQLANVSSGATAANLNDDDYHGPLMV